MPHTGVGLGTCQPGYPVGHVGKRLRHHVRQTRIVWSHYDVHLVKHLQPGVQGVRQQRPAGAMQRERRAQFVAAEPSGTASGEHDRGNVRQA